MWMITRSFQKRVGAAFAPFDTSPYANSPFMPITPTRNNDSEESEDDDDDNDDDGENFLVVGQTLPEPKEVEMIDDAAVAAAASAVVEELQADDNKEKNKDV